MKVAALLIVLLTGDGHWLSKTENAVTIRWNAPRTAVAADLHWELMLDNARLASGDTSMAAGEEDTTVKNVCPDVRAKTRLLWRWRLVAKAGGAELASGSEPIVAYPADLTTGWATLASGKKIVVIGGTDGLAGLLERAKVPHRRLKDAGALQAVSADVVMVDDEMLGDSPFEQAPLIDLAKGGAEIVVFRQTRPSRIDGISLVRRAIPREFNWSDHPLLSDFDADCRSSLERGWQRVAGDGLLAARPDNAGQSVEQLVQWPADATGNTTVQPPRDALLIVRSYGVEPRCGRMLLCQMPLGNWKSDPRSQIFVGRVLDYFLSSARTTGGKP